MPKRTSPQDAYDITQADDLQHAVHDKREGWRAGACPDQPGSLARQRFWFGARRKEGAMQIASQPPRNAAPGQNSAVPHGIARQGDDSGSGWSGHAPTPPKPAAANAATPAC